ncbi:MAG: DUF4249 family protein [Bacteroidales bacterium]
MDRNIYFLAFLFLLVTSCDQNSSEFTDTPIIEAYLRPGDLLNLVVSRQIPFSSDVEYSSDDLENLIIRVTHEGKTDTLVSTGDGRYVDSSLVVTGGGEYFLSFDYNSKTVSAYTRVPVKPLNFIQSAISISVDRMDSTMGPPSGGPGSMPDPVSLTWDNTDGSYYIVVIENMEATLDPIRDFGDDDRPVNVFRKPPTTASGLQLRPQEFQYFGLHRLILYHVLPDYASLYSESSNSSQNLTNPSTSITNGYGIFTGLNADTLYLQVKEN